MNEGVSEGWSEREGEGVSEEEVSECCNFIFFFIPK